ncbi:hypothetical protein C1N91_12630 [Curtobacterium sp. SGAir0471]|nr:hypothetical protein C1N91_12630 [Curtobacterium sp. SGAir0471]
MQPFLLAAHCGAKQFGGVRLLPRHLGRCPMPGLSCNALQEDPCRVTQLRILRFCTSVLNQMYRCGRVAEEQFDDVEIAGAPADDKDATTRDGVNKGLRKCVRNPDEVLLDRGRDPVLVVDVTVEMHHVHATRACCLVQKVHVDRRYLGRKLSDQRVQFVGLPTLHEVVDFDQRTICAHPINEIHEVFEAQAAIIGRGRGRNHLRRIAKHGLVIR